jgi:lipopolysaccharide/colanic/teichoic acid biosynthesis glycosyltransferase
VKRVVDVSAAFFLGLLLLPVIAATAVVVALVLGRPVLFRQARAGLGGRPFTLVKFRTMVAVDEARGLVTDAQRLTRLGRVLRSTSLDELPTLWNVLRGHMSLVGPRPLPMRYLSRYSREQARRHDVRPGITGLAQVRGRNWLDWDQKFKLDVAYVEQHSAGLDLRILAETVVTVLRRDGISARGEVTAAEFLGSFGRRDA